MITERQGIGFLNHPKAKQLRKKDEIEISFGAMMNFIESQDSEVRRLLAVWNVAAPPIRPSSEDIEWYAQNWKAGEKLRVFIQGVTPELVDLAMRKNASRIIAMDWHRPFFSAMRKLGRQDWGRVEELLNDWRKFVPELGGNLDMVLEDGSLIMVVFPSEWELVLKDIHRYLAPGGRIIFRLSFQPEEPFDIELYMKERLSRVDEECSGAGPEERLRIFWEAISEMRIAFGVASAANAGVVDLCRRAELVHCFHSEFTARCGHWREWEIARVAMPHEAEIWKGNKAGKAVPCWKAAVDLVQACGFRVNDVKWSGIRPVPGVMRLFAAERI
jgi:SAM-dependent methyltransferase